MHTLHTYLHWFLLLHLQVCLHCLYWEWLKVRLSVPQILLVVTLFPIGTWQLLSNDVAVETDWNVRHFGHEGVRQLQCEDLCGRNVLHFNLFPLLCDCSTIAQSHLCCSNEPLPNYFQLFSINVQKYKHPENYILQLKLNKQNETS